MKVFITGVVGFLGSHLADAMIADRKRVFGFHQKVIGLK
jgi:nucleoside-diphosphate-sugar epimerase